jgi:hypothetical protein
MATPDNRVQLPQGYALVDKNQQVTDQWYFYFQNITENQPPVGSGYVIDGSLGTNGYPITLFFGLNSDRGTDPQPGDVYFATDTGQIYISTGAGWVDQSPAFIGDVIKPAHSNVLTLATVNADVGVWGSSTQIPVITANAKGQIIAISQVPASALPVVAAGSSGNIQFNSGGVLGASPTLNYIAGIDRLVLTNMSVTGSIGFVNPVPTFDNLSPITGHPGAITIYDGTHNIALAGTGNQVLGMNNAGTQNEWKSFFVGDGLSLVNDVGSITFANTGVLSVTAGDTSITIGGTAQNPTVAVDLSNIDINSLTGYPLTIAHGGTGEVTANAALNAFLPIQSGNSGKYLTTDGTNTSWVNVTSGGFIPFFVPAMTSFTIPMYQQALWTIPIDNEGIIDNEGLLVFVD